MSKLIYPSTQTVDQQDEFHGIWVADPYRWLEDVDSPETLEWIAAQNRLTFGFLEAIPARERIRQRLSELWDYPKVAAPFKRGDRYFQFRNRGLQNQDVLYVLDSLDSESRLLLDPNLLSEDGTVALTNWSVSQDGNLLAYASSASGSDWMTWRIRKVDTGEDLPDVIQWSKFSGAAWLLDGSGFYYACYQVPQAGLAYEEANYDQKVYFHRLGTSQTEDTLAYQRPDQREWIYDARVSDDGRFLILHVEQGTDTRNRLFYQDLKQDSEMIELLPELEAKYVFIGNDGPVFYLHTDLDTQRGRVIAIDIYQPDRKNLRTLVPETSDTLEFVKLVHNEFIALYLQDATHRIQRYSLAGENLGMITLPTLGSISNTNFNYMLYGERADAELFYSFFSFAFPPTVFRFDFLNEVSEPLFAPEIRFDFNAYGTRQVFVSAKDGARIPLFLIHRKDLVPGGQNPALLYGYGGFNIPMTPIFSISRLAWLEMGGVLAWACLRGGGEYGEAWHQAGMRHQKQNVFDDFIACAEYLINSRITSTPKLAIQGRSNGGLLVGACLVQRPDLFGAALPGVGVLDMLRFHKFTIGWAWTSDYGRPEDPQDFETLYAYSPLHNIRTGVHYPATLITTADHDDRVVPGHSFKFAAALQAAQAGEVPILIRIQTKAGHGYGKPTAILIEEEADNWAFLVRVLGIQN
jgi:prolyl oligopeptidase